MRTGRSRLVALFYSLMTTLVIMIPAMAWAGTVDLPQTGQTTIYGLGDDGDIQAGVAWPSPRFTDNGDGTVTDNLTGLVWLKNANCTDAVGGINKGGGPLNWADALTWTNNLASGNCGLSDGSQNGDWRLPNINELESLVHAGYNEEDCGGTACAMLADWLNTQGFVNVVPAVLSDFAQYWSSTTLAGDTEYAWDVDMQTGEMDARYKPDSSSLYVWPVRGTTTTPAQLWKTGQTTSYAIGDDGDLKKGVAWPSPRFTDNGDGTVTDNLTGLVWLKDANCFGARDWGYALSFTSTLASGQCGLTDGSSAGDWRLPNRKELRSLIDYSQVNPALPSGHPFINVQSAPLTYYWSSTTDVFDPVYAWAVDVWWGIRVVPTTKTSPQYFWPVRDGQVGSLYNLDITKTGTGSGRVTSNPAGIDCGSTCSASYASGTTVTLTATPDADATFAGWDGNCADCGTATTCPITMDANKSCTATFDLFAPLPDIKANGSDGPVNLSHGDALSVIITLDPGTMTEEDADWWVLVDTPLGWYHYAVGKDTWRPGPSVTYQGLLFNLLPYEVLSTTAGPQMLRGHSADLPTGTYRFYFGVDMDMNGRIDMSRLYSDSVEVNIIP